MSLLELYREAYPDGSIADFHIFTSYFNLGIIISESHKAAYEYDMKIAKSILENKIKDRNNDRNI